MYLEKIKIKSRFLLLVTASGFCVLLMSEQLSKILFWVVLDEQSHHIGSAIGVRVQVVSSGFFIIPTISSESWEFLIQIVNLLLYYADFLFWGGLALVFIRVRAGFFNRRSAYCENDGRLTISDIIYGVSLASFISLIVAFYLPSLSGPTTKYAIKHELIIMK